VAENKIARFEFFGFFGFFGLTAGFALL